MDYEYWLRIGKHLEPVLIRQPLSVFREHEESLSTKERLKRAQEDYFVKKQYATTLAERLYCYKVYLEQASKYKLGVIFTCFRILRFVKNRLRLFLKAAKCQIKKDSFSLLENLLENKKIDHEKM